MTKSHKKRLLVGIIVVICCSIILVIVDKKFTEPTKATAVIIPYVLPKQASLTLTPKNYIDNYVSFDYPSIMIANQPQPPTLPIVDNIVFSYPDAQSWLLAVEIYKIPSGNLSDNSSYEVRIINPTTYLLTQSTINGKSVPIFTDTTSSGYSRVAFLISGNYQASVSLFGNDASGTTPLANTMAMVLNSWQWQGDY